MKIGILTYHRVCNFGAQLQTVSTVGFLKQKGYEPIVLNWYPKDLDEMYQKRVSSEQYKCHIDFAEQNMPLTKLCQTEDELLQVIDENNFDAIILGSDALFKYLPISERKVFSLHRLSIVNVCPTSDQILEGNPFWGSFIPKLKKTIPVIVFSVSSQNAPYKKTNKQEYGKLKRSLERFKYITVRDEWTKQMVQYFLGNIDIPITPDPVFSFNQNTYLPILSKQELKEKYNLPDKYVLLSFYFKKIDILFIKEIADQLITNGYTPIMFPHPEGLEEDYGSIHKIYTPLSPLEWYYLIKYSAGYIGERMHPIIVSLHNAVPFFCFDEYGTTKKFIPYINKFGKFIWKSSKIYHILSKAGLLDNVISIKNLSKITPQMVVERLLRFDKQKIQAFSERQQQDYNNSMNGIFSHITE